MTFSCPCRGRLTADNPKGAVCIVPPPETRAAREAAGLSPLVAIDYCMVPEVQMLWDAGVITGGVCCGHGDPEMSTILTKGQRSAELMRSLGYEETQPGWFTPKTKSLWSPND